MAESAEEEIDVEGISDCQQVSNLKDLADDDHKDKWYENYDIIICFTITLFNMSYIDL